MADWKEVIYYTPTLAGTAEPEGVHRQRRWLTGCELHKIIKGYGHAGDNASLDDLAKLTGMNKTVISPNHKFLGEVQLISGGRKKTATELGKKLSRALDHSQTHDISKYWREAVQTNEAVSGLVTTIRIKGGMTEADFTKHVLYVSGQSNTAKNRTGARSVVDLLVTAGLIQEVDGNLAVSTPTGIEQRAHPDLTPPEDIPEVRTRESATNPQIASTPISNPAPQITINIQLHLPETNDSEVYEKLFKALREQLISPKD